MTQEQTPKRPAADHGDSSSTRLAQAVEAAYILDAVRR